MLESFCRFLDTLENVEDGVESVLTPSSFDGMVKFISSVWGQPGVRAFENLFTQREDGGMVMSSENAGNTFCKAVFKK